MAGNVRIRLTLAAMGLLLLTSFDAPAVATQPEYVYYHHTFRSGFVTVSASAEHIRLSVVNGATGTLSPHIVLYTLSGSEWLSGNYPAAPGHAAQVEHSVRGTIQLRAVITVTENTGYDPNLFPVSLEIIEKRPDGWHTVTHIPFTESETVSGTGP